MNRVKMADFLIELRKEKNLLQQEVAEIFMVTTQAVSKWERGESIPDISILERMSEFYGVTIEEILNGERKELHQKEETAESRAEPNKRTISVPNIVIAGTALLLLLIFAALNYCGGYVGNLYVTFSLYDLMFRGTQFGNLLLLLAFLTTIGAIVLDILFGAGIRCKGKIAVIRDFLLVGAAGEFIGIPFGLYNPEGGSVLIILLYVAYLILTWTVPSYRAERKEFVTRKGHFLSTYLGIGLSVFSISILPGDNLPYAAVLFYGFFFLEFGLILAGYFVQGKVIEILKRVITAICIAITVSMMFVNDSSGILFLYPSIAMAVYLILLFAVPVLRIRNLAEESEKK